MVLVDVNGQRFYLDLTTKENLDYAYPKVMSGKYKFVAIVDGRSGYGKTTMTSQNAYYLTKGKLTLDNFCFNKEQALDQLTSAKPGTNIIIDEAFAVANRRTSRGMENMPFLSELQKMRMNKLFLWIILPSIYDLDKNIILSFCDLFFHCYGKPFGEKGNYACYDVEGIKKLYLYCRQTLDYKKFYAKPNYFGRFTDFFPLDIEEYEKKKKAKAPEQEDVKMHRWEIQRNLLVKMMYDKGTTAVEISKIIGCDDELIHKIVTDIEKFPEKYIVAKRKYRKRVETTIN